MTARPPGGTHIDCSTRDSTNAYVVDDGETTLVDAGWPGDQHAVRAGLALPASPRPTWTASC